MKVFIPFTRLVSETREAIQDPILVPVQGNDGYANYFKKRWEEGETFINVEHDILVDQKVLQEMWDCPEPWCVCSYPEDGHDNPAYLGCVKISDEFIKLHPNFWDSTPPWHQCDVFLARESKLPFHRHWSMKHIHPTPKKYSIIIPTCKEKNLLPCLESIRKYTALGNAEIIVVANGYDGDYPKDCTLVWRDEKIGYPAAINLGIKASEGEFLILLNDDTQLLEQPKNQWIDLLQEPFKDERMAITGPWMVKNTEIGRDFLIFFCVMIRKSVLTQNIGELDEASFGLGYGEDVDLCCRAVDAGWKIVQVPVQDKLPYDGRIAVGQFPIWHDGNATFREQPDQDLIHRNHAILRNRYDGVLISNAQKLGEWMNDSELRWLGRQAKKSNVVIELGSWFGKSATAIADNLPPSGVLYCIDTWQGSVSEQNTNHADARKMDGDYAYDQFCRNLQKHIVTGKVRPIRIHGRHGAALLRDMGIKADFIFIDAGHTRAEVQEDIWSLLPLRRQGGVISGHDYMQVVWPDVTPAVLDIFGGNMGQVPNTNIWATDAPPLPRDPKVYDCFTFNNEFGLLEKRLKTMWDVVDRFVIVEATVTHSGKPKKLQFHHNLKRFEPWLSKITYIVVEDPPPTNGTEESAWNIERFQRDQIMRGLKDCKPNDIIIVSDIDEIPNPEVIKSYDGEGIASLEMDLFLYDYRVKAKDPWYHAKILTYGTLKELTPCGARYAHENFPVSVRKNGGEHLSYFGGIETIQEKIHNTAHRNVDKPEFTDPDHIQHCIENGLDLFGRDIKYEVLEKTGNGNQDSLGMVESTLRPELAGTVVQP